LISRCGRSRRSGSAGGPNSRQRLRVRSCGCWQTSCVEVDAGSGVLRRIQGLDHLRRRLLRGGDFVPVNVVDGSISKIERQLSSARTCVALWAT
jgi:hypothetical protein